jgi:hypothetical protein
MKPFRLILPVRICGLLIIPLLVFFSVYLADRHLALLESIPLVGWHPVSIPVSSVFDSSKARWAEIRMREVSPVAGASGFSESADIAGGLFIKASSSLSGKDVVARGILRPYGSFMISKLLPESVKKRIKGRVAVLSLDESPMPFIWSRIRQWVVIFSSSLCAGALALVWLRLLKRKRPLLSTPRLLSGASALMAGTAFVWSLYLSLRYRPTIADTSILALGSSACLLLIAELASQLHRLRHRTSAV